jgi:hypothetical protein
MSRRCLALAAAMVAAWLLIPATAAADKRGDRTSIREVGHEPLMDRGMNSAGAINDDYMYIGSRTDGGHEGMPHGGIMVLDIENPRRPELLTEEPLYAAPGESSRELRVWDSQDILIVLNTNCGVGGGLHHCNAPSVSSVRFYDVGGRRDAETPRLVSEFLVNTHEFYLWEDPRNPRRALMFTGNAGSGCNTSRTNCAFAVWDISPVRAGGQPVTVFAGTSQFPRFPPQPAPLQKPTGSLHSLAVSNDGTEAYFALLTGGFALVDTSQFASGQPMPMPVPITENAMRPTWAGPGAHSAIRLWNTDWAYVSDEVYGTQTGSGHGCPWGWARMVDISNPAVPTVEAEFKLPENETDTCDDWNPPRTSYSAHNPTHTPNIVFTTWHSGGFQAINVDQPANPTQLAEFFPEPLEEVMLEDPRLSGDPDTGRNEKVVMWSYPIIKDGLIYVVDLRNGLYVLRYRGRFDREVRGVDFLEGNSNQGDALCFDPVGRPPRSCDDSDSDSDSD